MNKKVTGQTEYVDSDEVYLYDSSKNTITHTNNISNDYIDYIKKIDPQIVDSIGYTRIASMNLLRKVNDEIKPITFNASDKSNTNSSSMGQMGTGLSSYPSSLEDNKISFIEKNYDLLEGEYPKSKADLVLIVDYQNRVDVNVMKKLNLIHTCLQMIITKYITQMIQLN